MRGVSSIRAWLACVACVRAYVWDEREWHAGMMGMCVCNIIIFKINPASTLKSECMARLHTHTRARAHALKRQTCLAESSVPRESTVITGISKLKGWPVVEVRYLGCKSMKLEKSKGDLKSMIWTLKSQFGPLG